MPGISDHLALTLARAVRAERGRRGWSQTGGTDGTEITYVAEFVFRGLARVVAPMLDLAFTGSGTAPRQDCTGR